MLLFACPLAEKVARSLFNWFHVQSLVLPLTFGFRLFWENCEWRKKVNCAKFVFCWRNLIPMVRIVDCVQEAVACKLHDVSLSFATSASWNQRNNIIAFFIQAIHSNYMFIFVVVEIYVVWYSMNSEKKKAFFYSFYSFQKKFSKL